MIRRTVIRHLGGLVTLIGCLILIPCATGQQAPELDSGGAATGAEAQAVESRPDGVVEVVRAKVIISGGDEQSGRLIAQLLTELGQSALAPATKAIPGLRIDRVRVDRQQALTPTAYLAELVAYGERHGEVHAGESQRALAEAVQQQFRHLQEILMQEGRERASAIEAQIDKLGAERSRFEEDRAELAEQAQGHEAAATTLLELQKRLIDRQTNLIELQARRDAMEMMRDELAKQRELAQRDAGNPSESQRVIEQQWRELIAIREKQAAAATEIAAQGASSLQAAQTEALAQLVDARLQLAKFQAEREQLPAEAERLDQRLSDILRGIESAGIDIETSRQVTKALGDQIAELQARVGQAQQALSKLNEVNEQLNDIRHRMTTLKQSLATTRQWTPENGGLIRVQCVNGIAAEAERP